MIDHHQICSSKGKVNESASRVDQILQAAAGQLPRY